MNFNKKDFLNVKQIKSLIESDYSHDRAKTICDVLLKYCFVYNDALYVLQPNFTYQEVSNLKLSILNAVSLLIQKSHKKLTETDREFIEMKFPKKCKAILKNSELETFYPQLLSGLTKTNVVFNFTPGEIHFENGYMDVATRTFKKREIGSHIITKCIQREYTGSTQKQRDSVLSNIKKVYPDKKDMECIIYYLGSALSWKGPQDQQALFLLGLGSSGKSFIMELTKAVLGCYFVELGNDTFAGNTSNVNKVLNTYKLDPQILLSWVNEPVDKKMNGSLFKVWVDGNLQSTMLYKDGQYNFKHYSRCITTANTMPQIIVESGTTRRMISYTHQSDFTDDESKLDASKNIYLLDKYIIKNMQEKGLLDAWFDILVEYCYDWLNGNKPTYGANFKETKEAIVSSSDIFQDFIDSKLTITGDEKDKIGKDAMKKLFMEMYPDKHITPVQVMTSLKERKITYNTNMRSAGNIRGCYYGVKVRSQDDEEDKKVDKITEWANKYAELEAKYNALLQSTKVEPPKIEPVIVATRNTVTKAIFEEDEKTVNDDCDSDFSDEEDADFQDNNLDKLGLF